MTMMSFCRALLLSFGKTKRDDDDEEEEEEEDRNAGEQTFFCRFVAFSFAMCVWCCISQNL